jgi:hypothetical protein
MDHKNICAWKKVLNEVLGATNNYCSSHYTRSDYSEIIQEVGVVFNFDSSLGTQKRRAADQRRKNSAAICIIGVS